MKIQNISNNKREVTMFCREDDGSLTITKDSSYFPYYYELDPNGKFTTYDNKQVRKILCSVPGDVAKQRTANSYEADVLFSKRYIIDKIPTFDKAVLKYMFVDIEVLSTDMPDPLKAPDPISCITIYNSMSKSVQTWYMGDKKYDSFSTHKLKEQALLMDFVNYLKQEQPDMLLAWNMSFDYTYLHQRYPNFAKAISPIGEARYGTVDGILYPCGMSVVDYMEMFKKIYMREQSYALDNVAQKYLGEAPWAKTAFNVLSDIMRAKNVNDVKRMTTIETRLQILDYYDEIRRFATCTWEDLTANSRILDMVVLRESSKKGIVLPNKKKKEENDEDEALELQGAYRRAEGGVYKNIYKADIVSMYPSQMVNFCLDAQNVMTGPGQDIIDIEGLFVKQDETALLPTITKQLMLQKDALKRELKGAATDSQEQKSLQNKYNAIKGLVNSMYGVTAFAGFRLYNFDIASRITSLSRNLLMYVENKMKEMGYEVIYTDTDALMYKAEQDEIELLNKLVQDWAIETYNKFDINISFESEGMFTKLLIMTKCRYLGYLQTPKGLKTEIKGMEMKRSSSSKYEGEFQRQLVDLVLEEKTKEELKTWVNDKIAKIKSEPLVNVAFPAKIANKEYKNIPIFVRAYKNTQDMDKSFKLNKGELFHYIFTKDYGKDSNKKEINVVVVTDSIRNLNDHIDWEEVLRRNIYMKTDAIFEALFKEPFTVRAHECGLGSHKPDEGVQLPCPLPKKRGRKKKEISIVDSVKVSSPILTISDTNEQEKLALVQKSEDSIVNSVKAVTDIKAVISHSFKTNSLITERTIKVSEAFGLGIDDEKEFSIYENTELKYKSNDIVYITGDSGSGKSWLLNNHFAKLDNAINIDDIAVEDNVPIIEQLGKTLPLALEYLNIAGLGDAFLYLRTYAQLSDGQKYRFRIAKLLDMQDKDVWLIDEFCATLDRTTAKIISYNLHKIVKKVGKMLIVATTHNDLRDSLRPNVYIQKGYETDVDIKYFEDTDYPEREFELLKHMKIEEGDKTDYESLKRFHYRQAALGATKNFYKCTYEGNVIGTLVICYPHLALKGRNIAFNDKWARMSKETCTEINEVIENISRVIVHPKYRGIGLAQYMLKEYFKLSKSMYVETIAVMANYNPFFEKAGMTRVQTVDESNRMEKIKVLEKYGFNINLLSSKKYSEDHYNTLTSVQQVEVKEIIRKILTRWKGQISKLFAHKATIEEVMETDLFGAMKELPRADTVYLYKKLK